MNSATWNMYIFQRWMKYDGRAALKLWWRNLFPSAETRLLLVDHHHHHHHQPAHTSKLFLKNVDPANRVMDGLGAFSEYQTITPYVHSDHKKVKKSTAGFFFSSTQSTQLCLLVYRIVSYAVGRTRTIIDPESLAKNLWLSSFFFGGKSEKRKTGGSTGSSDRRVERSVSYAAVHRAVKWNATREKSGKIGFFWILFFCRRSGFFLLSFLPSPWAVLNRGNKFYTTKKKKG